MTDQEKREATSLSRRPSRRELLIGAAATAGLGVAGRAARASGAQSPGFPGTTQLAITVRGNPVKTMDDMLQEYAKKWGEKNNVKVSLEVISLNDIQTKAATAAEVGSGPDIMMMFLTAPQMFAEKLVNLDELGEALAKKHSWYKVAEETCKVGGHWKAIPYFATNNVINYREDFFKAAGITALPKTWDEMLEAGKKLKAAKQPPMGFALGHAVGDANNFCYPVLWAHGGAELATDGKTVTINSPETLKSIQWMQRFFNEAMTPDVLSWDDTSNNRAFLAGQISATSNAASIYWAAAKDAPIVHKNMNHFSFPAGPQGRVEFTYIHSLSVMGYSKNQAAAKDFLAYLMEEEQLTPFVIQAAAQAGPLLQSYENRADMPWNKDPKLAAVKDVPKFAKMPGYKGAPSAKGAEAWARFIIVDMYAKAVSGTSAADAMKWAENELKQVYGR